MMPLGKHYLAEFFDCDTERINDLTLMEQSLEQAVHVSGATLIKTFFHQFSPHGISGVVIIAESHFAVHCWPEHNYMAVDLFSCSDFDYGPAMELLRRESGAGRMTLSVVDRGVLPEGEGGPAPLEIRVAEMPRGRKEEKEDRSA